MIEWWHDSFPVFVGNIHEWGAGDLVKVFGVAGVIFNSFVPIDQRMGKHRNFTSYKFKKGREMVRCLKGRSFT